MKNLYFLIFIKIYCENINNITYMLKQLQKHYTMIKKFIVQLHIISLYSLNTVNKNLYY